MGYGRRGRYPGNGPFRDLPPWQRPGRTYGYGGGFGRGFGRGYNADPTTCARFPWLPRWWWSDPENAGSYPMPPATNPDTEKQYLEGQLKLLSNELEQIKKRLGEIKPETETN